MPLFNDPLLQPGRRLMPHNYHVCSILLPLAHASFPSQSAFCSSPLTLAPLLRPDPPPLSQEAAPPAPAPPCVSVTSAISAIHSTLGFLVSAPFHVCVACVPNLTEQPPCGMERPILRSPRTACCPRIDFPSRNITSGLVVRLTSDNGYETTHVCGAQRRPSSSSGCLSLYSTCHMGALGEHSGCR